jgi:hypothetical protein
MGERLGAVPDGLEGSGNVELGLCIGGTGGGGVLVVAERAGEIAGSKAFAALTRRHLHHCLVACAWRGSRGAVGLRLLDLQCGYLLLQLVQFGLLLLKLPLVGLDRPLKASGERACENQGGDDEKGSVRPLSHTIQLGGQEQSGSSPVVRSIWKADKRYYPASRLRREEDS